MVEIKGNIKKIGNSYWLLVPKALIDCKVIDENKEVTFQLQMGLLYNLARKSYSDFVSSNICLRVAVSG